MKYGLAGGTYRGFSPQSCPQRTVNVWPQTISAKGERVQRRLVHVPGKRLFGMLPDQPGRGIFAQDGRCYAVSGGTLGEIFSDGSVIERGAVRSGTGPVTFAGSGARGFQVMVTSGGLGYILNTSTNALAQITDPQFPGGVITCGYLDGYFVVVTFDRFQISTNLDGLSWGADVGQRIGAPEAIVGAVMDHEVLWLAGRTQTEVWYDSGAASFPIAPVPGVFLEYGLEATHAICKVGDSILWLGSDERGGRQVFRNQGYNAIPVSHEGISAALTALPSVADARMYSYQIHNHTFAVLTIPSQQMTLQYDIAENEWSELLYWNSTAGVYEADRSSCHAYCFGKHLTLDRQTGAIWELSMDIYADGDAPRRWMRVGPVISDEDRMVFHHRAVLDGSVGVGLVTGQGSDPRAMLRYSDNAGATWTDAGDFRLGALGNYDNLPALNRLGSGRRRVYELTGSDPVPISLNELLLDVTRGTH